MDRSSNSAAATPPSASTSSSAGAPSAGTLPRFQGIKTLGTAGKHGFVQLAQDNTRGVQCAIKYIPRELVLSSHKYVVREVLNHHQLSQAKHPHLLEFREVFLTPRYLGIVMEYFDGQDLQAYIAKKGGNVQEDTARFIFQQMVLAVDFMHRKGKVHRDITLEHVLVEDSGLMPLIKLRSFHFSKDRVHDSSPQTQIGTALFTAPEVFMNVGGHAYDGEAVDVWACGVVLYMMLFGLHPFLSEQDMALDEGQKLVRLIENMVRGQLQMPPSAEGSLAADLLQRILVPAPKQRYAIKHILAHPWFLINLPPGAIDLNSSICLVQGEQAEMLQTPDQIKQIIGTVYQSPPAAGAAGARPATTSFSRPNSGAFLRPPSSDTAAKQQLRMFSMSDDCVNRNQQQQRHSRGA